MKRLAIIGSGDLGHQIAYHALVDGHYEPVGFFDDWCESGVIKHGLPVFGKTEDVLHFYQKGEFDVLMIGIGYKHLGKRKEIFNLFKDVIPFGNIIHTSAYIDPGAKIGQGVFIYPGCVLDMNVILGDNVLLNAGCLIAHDSSIGDNSFLSPGVRVAGFTTIEESVNLGIGTCVIDNVVITARVKTGGGAVVVSDLSEPGLYVGVPAKLIKKYDSI